jgi:hypothetical protein
MISIGVPSKACGLMQGDERQSMQFIEHDADTG